MSHPPPILELPEELKAMVINLLEGQDLINVTLMHREWKEQAVDKKWHSIGPLGFEHLMNHQKVDPANQQSFVDRIHRLHAYTSRFYPATGTRLPQLNTTHLKFHHLRSLHFEHPNAADPGLNLNITQFINPSLTELRVSGGMNPPPQVANADNFLLALGQCTKLRKFELGRAIQGATPAQLQSALTTLSSLDSVSISNGAAVLVNETTVVQLASIPSLTVLALDVVIDGIVAQNILNNVYQPFKSLEFAWLTLTHHATQRLLPIMDTVDHLILEVATAGPIFDRFRFMTNLSKLQLTMPHSSSLDHRMLMNLQYLNLTHLTMHAPPRGFSGFTLTVPEVASFLSSFPNLVSLHLDWTVTSFTGLTMLHLAGSHCRSLRELGLLRGWRAFDLNHNAVPAPMIQDLNARTRVFFPELLRLTLSRFQPPLHSHSTSENFAGGHRSYVSWVATRSRLAEVALP